MFRELNDTIQTTNDELQVIVEQESNKMIEAKLNIKNEEDLIQANVALQERVKDFIL